MRNFRTSHRRPVKLENTLCQIHPYHRILHLAVLSACVALNTTTLAHCDAVWGGRQPSHLEQRPLIYDQAEVGRAGVFVTLDRDGSLAVYRGYARPEDEPREETAVQDGDGADAMGQGSDVGVSSWKPSATSAGGTVITSRGQPIGADASDEEDDGALKPLPERLVMELTAHRTLALREAIGRSNNGL